MKLALLWFAALTFAIIGSCSVNHRSGDYACAKQSDCASPRVCEQGFCTVPPGVPIDGPPSTVDGHLNQDASTHPDASSNICPSICTSCDLGSHKCKIECNLNPSSCNGTVTCPDGFDCNIDCNTPNACRNGVDCTNAAACAITCVGTGSCRGLQCGDGPCSVFCTGSSSCRGIACNGSCACDVECGSISLCQDISCPGLACDTVTGGCNLTGPGCNTCM